MNGNAYINYKMCVYTATTINGNLSVLKIKGKLITCKTIYLLHCICHHCFREVFFPLC